ncbi:MAG TPA: TonB-dependent receptor [Longimicrobiales bacterium]|nr:TonB-dependent receptor [Longimicrobiales bacterium]
MKKSCGAFVPMLAAIALLLVGAPQALHAQQAAVRGTVTDAQTGQPIAGAQVAVRGTGIGTLTNNDGRFVLTSVPAGRLEIRVEYIGYSAQQQTITVAAGETATVDFEMGITAIQLEELVATGYAQQTRRELSSAISSVGNQDLENRVVASLDAALQGKAAGVQVIQNAGNPGNGITVRVRGSASISASNQPLYVVDGVPIFREDFGQLGLGGQDMSAITGLNPDEIESIDILKDAAASAIYGSRGSNGVIMITTKRGASGAPRITVNTSAGFQNAARVIDVLNTAEWMQYFADGMRYDGYTEARIQSRFDAFGVDPNIDTNWQEEVLRTAPVSNTQIALSGGTDRFKYFLSGTYFDQMGIILGSAYDRAAGRVNLDFQATDRLNVSASIALSQEDNDRIESDNSIVSAVTNAIANEPWVPVVDDEGNWSDWASYSNPVAVGREDYTNARTLRSFGNLTASYGLTSWLNLTGRAGFDVLALREHRWNSPLTPLTYGAGVGGVSRVANSWGQRSLLETFMTAHRYFGANEISATVGASVEMDDQERSFIRGEGFTSPELNWPGNAAEVAGYDGTAWEHNLMSYFARANYVFDERYVINASLRTDGSSRFGENQKFGVFPAISAAWILSNEAFMANVGLFSDLKLRASWGQTGNEAIGDFEYLGLVGTSNYGNLPGTNPTNLANPDLKWETTTEWNLGADMGLLSDRLGIVAELYSKDTDDLLLNRPVPSTSGYTSVLANIGGIRNSGVELTLRSLNLRPSRPGALEWTSEFNITRNRNEVTALYNGQPFGAGFMNWVEVGQPLGVFYAPEYIGVDEATGVAKYADLDDAGEYQYDANGDLEWTTFPGSNDRRVVGSPHPDFYGGLRNTLSFGGFDLMAFLEFSQGAEIYNAMRLYSDDGGYFLDNKFSQHVEDYWTPENTDGKNPSPSWFGSTGVWVESSRMIEDASYVRIGDVTLGYRLPAAVNNLVRTQSARLYVSGKNLHTWTEYSGYSPDNHWAGSGSASAVLGTDFYAYPQPRTITFGFQGTW